MPAFAVDSGNRLWVAIAGYTDDGHDGVPLVLASGAVVEVAGLHTPMGMVWYHDELYVASKERVDAHSALVGAPPSTAQCHGFPAGVGRQQPCARTRRLDAARSRPV